MFAPARLERRAASGYHWSQQTSTPRRPKTRVEIHEAQIAGREVEFFEVQRIVRDVHLAIDAGDLAIGSNHGRGVVIESRAAPFEKRRNDDDAELARQLARAYPWTGPGIASASANSSAFSSRQKYCERNSSCRQTICAPLGGRLANLPLRFLQVLVGVQSAAHLHQADTEFLRRSKDCISPLSR